MKKLMITLLAGTCALAACSNKPEADNVVVADNGSAMTAPPAGGDANMAMRNLNEAGTGDETNRVFFVLDSADLTDAGRQQLDRIAGAYAETPGTGITLAGFTDTTGTKPYNKALSGRRAAAVKAYLVEKGVPASEIESEAQGQSSLRVDTGDNVAEPANRRVRIELGDQP